MPALLIIPRSGMIERLLYLDLPVGQSAFLWGPRKTGKTTYLKARFPQSVVYDFLQSDQFIRYSKNPHFMREELVAYCSYRELDFRINFWRTKTGLEVDFILDDGRVAVEVKGSNRVDNRETKSIRSFRDEFRPDGCYVVCNEPTKRVHNSITIVPWRDFLHDLWQGQIV